MRAAMVASEHPHKRPVSPIMKSDTIDFLKGNSLNRQMQKKMFTYLILFKVNHNEYFLNMNRKESLHDCNRRDSRVCIQESASHLIRHKPRLAIPLDMTELLLEGSESNMPDCSS